MKQNPEKVGSAKSAFKFLERIGSGTFGSIWRGQARADGEEVAIKVMKKKMMEKADFEDLDKELDIMNVLDHPNITRMIAVFDEDEYYFLVSELMQGGDLAESINTEYADVSEEDVQGLITPLFDAVIYCHDLGIAHRDLKPENILLTCPDFREATVKICDFGMSRKVAADLKAKTIAGTPNYIAPEILQ